MPRLGDRILPEKQSVLGSMVRLDNYIIRRRWNAASEELKKAITRGALDVGNFDLWGQYAGKIENGLGQRWDARRNFWLALDQTIRAAERRTGIETHKGLVYFKIGVLSLVSQHASFASALKWLHRAYHEDKRTYGSQHKDPNQQSAYRMLVILRAFERFRRGIKDPSARNLVNNLVSNHASRIGRLMASTYDMSLGSSLMGTRLTEVYFDRLLGRNPYRPLVEQNFRGAEWLMAHRYSWHLDGTNLEKYGIAQAVVVLCGTTIEGLLLKRVRLPKGNRRHRNLAVLVLEYLKRLKSAPELVSGLVFLWFARDLIHPEVARRTKSLVLDLNFSQFAIALTRQIIILLSRRSRRGATRRNVTTK